MIKQIIRRKKTANNECFHRKSIFSKKLHQSYSKKMYF